jgi:uncharacterized membrane protein YoaK (UPF0700 family)
VFTYCPRCKKLLTIEEYDAYEKCPDCSQDFNRLHYILATLMSVFMGGGIWILAIRFPKNQWSLAWGLSTAMIVIWFFQVPVDVWIKNNTNMTKPLRRRIVSWLSVILALFVGICVDALTR